MSLEEITFIAKNITKGMDVLKGMKSLKVVAGNPGGPHNAEAFWKKYDAGEFK